MSTRKLSAIVSLLAGAVLVGVTVAVFAQQPTAGGVKINSIRSRQIQAPSYSGSNTSLGGVSASSSRPWLQVEVEFEAKPKWSDELTLKYYVVMTSQDNTTRLMTAEITHVNIPQGRHNSAVFMPPNALDRFGAGRVDRVAVLLYQGGRLLDTLSDPQSSTRWWEKFTPITGMLQRPWESPWAPIAHMRYAEAKRTP